MLRFGCCGIKLQISRKREIPEEEQGKEVFQPVSSALEFEF
jgi:hypothetical protein